MSESARSDDETAKASKSVAKKTLKLNKTSITPTTGVAAVMAKLDPIINAYIAEQRNKGAHHI